MTEPDGVLTVLMAVHNGAPYLRTAIESLLRQSYTAFRFLIVDDASTDETREIVRGYADRRIQLVCLERNIGQTAALNVGLRRISTPWIARMDADDYSAPTRLEEQLCALQADRFLQCVGTFAWVFRDDPTVVERILKRPIDHAAILRGLFQGTPIIHGSLVISRQALIEVGGYDERYRYTADRELYARILPRSRAANIPKPLLGVRRHDGQHSMSTVAAEEYLRLIAGMRAASVCSPHETRLIRATLTAAYLVRARHYGAESRYGELLRDLLCAVWCSPLTVMERLLAKTPWGSRCEERAALSGSPPMTGSLRQDD